MTGIASMTFTGSSDASLLRANIATTATPCLVVHTVGGGHNPPITQGVYGGGSGACVPWQAGFYIEGSCTSNCSGDGHAIVFVPSTGMMYELGEANYAGGVLSAYDGIIDFAGAFYDTQWENKGDNCQVAGVCFLSFADMGEDFLAAEAGIPFNHPLSLIIPTKYLISGTNGVNYSHGVGNGGGSCTGSANCLELGDLIAYTGTCNQTDLRALYYCLQFQQNGLVVTDTESNGQGAQTRLALDLNGQDDTDAAMFAFQQSLTPANFRLIQRGSLIP